GEAAGLKAAGDDHHVRAGVNQMGQVLVEADFDVAVRVVVQLALQTPEMIVDLGIGTGAQQHELPAPLQDVKDGVTNELQPLLRIQAADEGDDGLFVVGDQQS